MRLGAARGVACVLALTLVTVSGIGTVGATETDEEPYFAYNSWVFVTHDCEREDASPTCEVADEDAHVSQRVYSTVSLCVREEVTVRYTLVSGDEVRQREAHPAPPEGEDAWCFGYPEFVRHTAAPPCSTLRTQILVHGDTPDPTAGETNTHVGCVGGHGDLFPIEGTS